MPEILRRWMFLFPLTVSVIIIGVGAWIVYTDPWKYVNEWVFFWQCVLLALPNVMLTVYWLAVRWRKKNA